MPVLSRTGQTSLDVGGTFRAWLGDAGGAGAGWLQVRVPPPDEPRVFQAALPPLPPKVGPAVAVALDSELDWLDAHTIDVYRARGGDRGRGQGRGR